MIIELTIGLFVISISFLIGQVLITNFFKIPHHTVNFVLSVGLGLGILVFGLVALSVSHQLTTQNIWLLMAVLAVVSLIGFRYSKINRSSFNFAELKHSFSAQVLSLLTLVALLAALAGVFTPEIANDSLCYHVNLPKLFLMHQKLYTVPFDVNTAFPLLMEMLFAMGLAIKNIFLAKFFHYICGILCALGIFLFSQKFSNFWASLAAACLFVTTPGVLNQMGTTYVDVGLSFFTLLSIICILNWTENKETFSWAVLGGIFMGLALGIKFLALISMLGIYAIFLFEISRTPKEWRKTLHGLLLFSLAAGLAASFWYIRSWFIWDNPVYPYFYQIFKSGDATIHYDDIGLSKNLFSFFSAPWFMTMNPLKFEGFGDQIGPGYLLFLPLAIIFHVPRPLNRLWLWILVYYTSWFFLGQSLRFLMPMLPILCLVIASGIFRAQKQKFNKGLTLTVLTVLAIHTSLGVYHYRREIKPALGLELKESYLAREERSYNIARWCNQNLPKNSKILAADESHLFYFNFPIIREISLSLLSQYHGKYQTAEAIIAFTQSLGITHILWSKNFLSDHKYADSEAKRIPAMLLKNENEIAQYLKALYTTTFKNHSNHIQYTIFEIQ